MVFYHFKFTTETCIGILAALLGVVTCAAFPCQPIQNETELGALWWRLVLEGQGYDDGAWQKEASWIQQHNGSWQAAATWDNHGSWHDIPSQAGTKSPVPNAGSRYERNHKTALYAAHWSEYNEKRASSMNHVASDVSGSHGSAVHWFPDQLGIHRDAALSVLPAYHSLLNLREGAAGGRWQCQSTPAVDRPRRAERLDGRSEQDPDSSFPLPAQAYTYCSTTEPPPRCNAGKSLFRRRDSPSTTQATRATCPWHYHRTENAFRYPRVLHEAYCLPCGGRGGGSDVAGRRRRRGRGNRAERDAANAVRPKRGVAEGTNRREGASSGGSGNGCLDDPSTASECVPLTSSVAVLVADLSPGPHYPSPDTPCRYRLTLQDVARACTCVVKPTPVTPPPSKVIIITEMTQVKAGQKVKSKCKNMDKAARRKCRETERQKRRHRN